MLLYKYFKNQCIHIIQNHSKYISNRYIWLIDSSLMGIIIPDQTLPVRNGSEGASQTGFFLEKFV